MYTFTQETYKAWIGLRPLNFVIASKDKDAPINPFTSRKLKVNSKVYSDRLRGGSVLRI
jgi:hypothetical protein